MRLFLQAVAAALAMIVAPMTARAQGTRADYERAKELRQRTENTVFKAQLKAH
jgi:hypothetical protein